MFNFNFFNRKPQETLSDLMEEYDVMDTTEPEVKSPHCHFTVGVDENFSTVLKLHQEHGFTTTLTLNKPAVERLIRLLQVSLDEEPPTNNVD